MSLDEMGDIFQKAFRVSAFTSVGHLLHINLKDHLLQHKNEIGKALLAKNPRALAVVNKVNSIDNTYRNFEIEVIAKREGCEKTDEELMLVEVNENKCRFQLDFSKVYWNSRLSTEHERILRKLNKGHDIVFDLFAGVGPFSVPAAKAKCKTYVNDLNPDAVNWLEINMKRNKVQKNFYRIYNMDAKDFILNELKPRLYEEYMAIEEEELATKPKVHILMNLPALAPTFLPHFVGLFRRHARNVDSSKLIQIHKQQNLEHIVYCYCFLKGLYDNPKAEVRSIVEGQLDRELNDDQLINIFRVRNVAPYKDMYRVEIRLDEDILTADKSTVGIMKSLSDRLPINGISKKVTIQNGKRTHNESEETIVYDLDEEEEQTQKRAKLGDYCQII